MGVVMSDKVLIIKTKEDIEKIAFLAPLVAGAKAVGGAAMAGGRAVAGLATRAAQSPIGQKIGAAAKRVDDVANDPRAKAAAKAKEARDAHKQSQEMRAQEQVRGAKESADRARKEAGIATGEPMDIAFQLLKERVSPEAKRHKLEYDKKYESTPERVKYREELNRERKKRGIYGHGGPDMSHTKDHRIVPEDPHTNRARHFREMGTLL
tara:strand:- start:46 stop:672 length:627 start_codon:yes stop_codon:yes gene_type:complete